MRLSDALDRKAEEIKRPPNLPLGHYIWQIKQLPEQGSVGEDDRYDTLDFRCQCMSACEDVDPDELAEFGNLQSVTLSNRFMFDTHPDEGARFDRSMFNLKRFLENLNIGFEESTPLNEALSNCVGAQFKGELRHRPNPNDPEQVFQEIGRTAPAD